jgi:hypothetical protein
VLKAKIDQMPGGSSAVTSPPESIAGEVGKAAGPIVVLGGAEALAGKVGPEIAEHEATGFLGSRRAPLANAAEQPLRNADSVIGGRTFSGHALDQMQNRGLMPSVVENTIQHGVRSADPIAGRFRFFDPVNNVTVITEGKRVVTAIPGKLWQMSQGDNRNLRRMLECIGAARTGRMTLVGLADALLHLRDALDAVDPAWAEELTSHIATLESAGLATSEQIRTMGPKYEEVIANTLAAAERLVFRLGVRVDDVEPADESWRRLCLPARGLVP